MLWRIWDPKSQKVKAQSAVIFDEERNAHMSCLHESNEIDTNIFGLSDNEEYMEETDTGDEPLQRQDSQPMQSGQRSTSHMDEGPDEEAESAHSWHLRREDQTAQRSAADAENIAHSRRLRTEEQTAWRSAAAINKSSQVARAPPTPVPVAASSSANSESCYMKSR